ncbi:trypsin-like serine protease [Streptomyces sp. TS71-3]|uniref:trypsin-like serine protease n=1 Tax=Streptomyces sp. TS71-3 TaxID=2733862 RepID=UPI001B281216|nr:trypsin-like serine protease [Streptomyces sp. TS71-3]GHJ41164.1 esterase [Streptomyces sp. TS71-3]
MTLLFGKRRTTVALLIAVAAIGSTTGPAHAVTGPVESNNLRGYTARLDIGDGTRGCSGALIDPEWLITAASCFADDPASSIHVPPGVPKQPTRAVIGRTDLTTTQGAERAVVKLVPRDDRDIVLAKLSAPVAGVRPAVLADTAPQAGEKLIFTGYGRTGDEWAPIALHNGTFSAGPFTGTDLEAVGDDAAVCPGDTGGPLVRTNGDQASIVALASRSDQGGCFGIDPEITSTQAVNSRVDGLGDWIGSVVRQAPFVDFNGDGVEDIAISDPEATVGGDAEAGLVRIVYGGGQGTAQIDQDLSFVPGGSEPGDRFGQSLATVDYDSDGYTDLVVGVPYEDLGGAQDAGMVTVIHGSAAGLGQGRAADNYQQGQGNGALKEAVSEQGDLLGYALSAGHTSSGDPFIVIGAPGEGLGSFDGAGAVIYVRGGTNVAVQAEAGLTGKRQTGARTGWSVAADGNHIAIGAPGRDIGGALDAGDVWLLSHTLGADGRPVQRAEINEDRGDVSGGAETGDALGTSVSLAGSGTDGDSILAVGVPGESLTDSSGKDMPNAGGVLTFSVTASGTWAQDQVINQDTPDVTGGAEPGDRFGESLAALNLSPRTEPTWQSLQLVIGVPGEAQGTTTAAGGIQTVTLLGPPGQHNDVLYAGYHGLPGAPGAGERMGQDIAASPTHIYVGMPLGPYPPGAAYSVPWPNLTGGADQPVTVYQPGQDGIPSGGQAFGTAIR